MSDIVNISYDNDQPTVLGRELHQFLGVKARYNDWFSRMCEYGFIEGTDYYSFLSNRSDGLSGKPKTDHQLNIDMAKEICMLQRNERGKQARRYFLELEKAWNSPERILARALQLANKENAALKEEKALLKTAIEEQKPQVLFAEAVTASDSSILIGNLAKLLKQNGYNIGQNRLFALLRGEGYLCSRRGDQWNMPTQKSMELGLFEVEEYIRTSRQGVTYPSFTTKVTGKGQIFFVNRYCGKRNHIQLAAPVNAC